MDDDPLTAPAGEGAVGFEVLSDETRLGILRALAARLRDHPEDPSLGFADLRRTVGRRDSGNFNYHLDQLRGRFVRDTDEGYRITAAGLRVVAALIAGVYGAGERFGPTELDDRCPVCDGVLTATYEDGLVTVVCDDDHEFRNPLPPGAVDDRGLAGVVDLLTLRIRQDMEMATEGVCPFCYATLDWSVDPDFDAELPHFTEGCSRCGARVEVPAAAAVFHHPEVVAFYHDHGIDLRRRPMWAPEFYRGVAVATGADPVRIRVTLELDGDALTATLDESLAVVGVER